MFRRWIEGTLQGVLATVLVALVPGAVVTYLAKIGSTWTEPILLGLGAAALVSIVAVSVNAIRRLPARRIIVDLENVESSVRLWLSNFRVSVKNDPVAEAHFRLAATMDSGTVMTVVRPRGEFSHYIIIRSDITPTPDELKAIDGFPEDEAERMFVEIKLQLSHFRVGFSALGKNPFHVFKRLPIDDALTEHTLMAALDEVEAAMHSVSAMFYLGLQRNKKSAAAAALIKRNTLKQISP